ncbi:MAG: hypothetical protein Ct9H300mP1_17240 [Planctomycetaceae bacterium]|nr:MAG: hypothetical protein Ct9H300mP1_17240 [Planctomycetaceae bacterium]
MAAGCYYHPGESGAWAGGPAGVKPEIYEYCYQLGTNVINYSHAGYSKWLEARKQKMTIRTSRRLSWAPVFWPCAPVGFGRPARPDVAGPVEEAPRGRAVQLKIAEKYFGEKKWKVALAEYEKYLTLYEDRRRLRTPR